MAFKSRWHKQNRMRGCWVDYWLGVKVLVYVSVTNNILRKVVWETWNKRPMGLGALLENQLAIGKSSRSCTYISFLPQGVEIELSFALRAAVSKIQANFQNSHIWAWNLASGQSSRSCTYTLFLHQGVEIELIFALWAAVSEIQANFQNCHIWAWNLAIGQSSRSCTYTLFLPVEIELIFALRAAVSEIRTNFQNCHIWKFWTFCKHIPYFYPMG